MLSLAYLDLSLYVVQAFAFDVALSFFRYFSFGNPRISLSKPCSCAKSSNITKSHNFQSSTKSDATVPIMQCGSVQADPKSTKNPFL